MAQPSQGRLALRIGGAPPDARFYITTAPAMPRIALLAELIGATPAAPVTFNWRFALAYSSYILTRRGQSAIPIRAKTHPAMAPISSTDPRIVVPFTALMCGRLSVTLTATVNGQSLTATRTDILIGGTNPSAGELDGVLTDPIVRKMVMQESGRKQFSDAATRTYVAQAINPNWSSDGQRGVGLGQLTVPPPTDADIWNWRENARSLQRRFREKQQGADRFAARVGSSARFAAEIAALNQWRVAEGQRPLQVTAPALTPAQRDREALRGYNGFGPSVPGQYLSHVHEYEPRMIRYTSATRRNSAGAPVTSGALLAVDDNGAISWEQISGAERRRRYVAAGRGVPGEPDYVAQVLAQP